MGDIAADVLAYGLAAGLSATAFLATVVVLASSRGSANAAALLLGFVVVLLPSIAVAALMTDLVVGAGGQQTISALVKLILGLFMLVLAWRLRPWVVEGAAVEAKLGALETRFEGLGRRDALRLGIGLAVLPKRLVITLLAGSAIGSAGLTVAQGIGLGALYVLTATILVWATILIDIIGRDRSTTVLQGGRTWVTRHAASLGFTVTLLFGLLFTGQSIVELVS